jgi:hypothetical protein
MICRDPEAAHDRLLKISAEPVSLGRKLGSRQAPFPEKAALRLALDV